VGGLWEEGEKAQIMPDHVGGDNRSLEVLLRSTTTTSMERMCVCNCVRKRNMKADRAAGRRMGTQDVVLQVVGAGVLLS
jgi:hypothetical protein